MVRLTVVIPFLYLVACVCTYPYKIPDNEELYDHRNIINNQSLRLSRQTCKYYFYGNNYWNTQNPTLSQHLGNINYDNGTSKPAHIVNIHGGVANGGSSYGSGNGGHGGFNTLSGDKHQKMHVESGHGDKEGEGGKGGGQIKTSGVVIAKNNNNPENRTENNNQQIGQEPVTLLDLFSSNGPINMSTDDPASIAMKPITESRSEAEAQSINNQNVRPGNNNSKKTVNEFNNEGAGHGPHDNGNGTSKPAHIVNIDGGVANGGASYGSGNGGHGGFNTLSGDKHQKMHVDSGHEDKGGEGGKGDGQITTSEVVITKNNNNQENRTENNNQEPVTLLEAISSSNGPINMSISNPASVARKPITGGGSEAGATSINDPNVRPGNNNSKKTVNEFNNEGAGHGSHDNGNDNGHEYTGGPVELVIQFLFLVACVSTYPYKTPGITFSITVSKSIHLFQSIPILETLTFNCPSVWRLEGNQHIITIIMEKAALGRHKIQALNNTLETSTTVNSTRSRVANILSR
ncbi:hypothetical protein SFRURICE_007112 [Spodoptera frugiperda]|nr:hypothetical protein SFRURICE_007112 [Spodoptera frugiperda]